MSRPLTERLCAAALHSHTELSLQLFPASGLGFDPKLSLGQPNTGHCAALHWLQKDPIFTERDKNAPSQ